MANNDEYVFICLLAICISCLRRVYSVLLPLVMELFVFLILSFQCSLYMLGSNPFWDVSFTNIFSQSSHSLDSVFRRLEVFNFNDSLKLISFMKHVFTACWISYHHMQDYLDFLLLCKRFTFLCLTVYMVHFELIFMKWVKALSRFICVHADVRLLQHFWKTVFASLYCLYSSVKDQLTIFMRVNFYSIYLLFYQYYTILVTIGL